MQIRLVRMLNIEGIPHAFELALIHGLMILALAVPITVLPLRVLELLGDSQQVSVFFLCVGVMGLCGALSLPFMLERLGRVRLTAVGLLGVLVSALLFSTGDAFAFFIAVVLYTWGFFSVDIILNIVVMERIERRSFVRFEAVRMGMLGISFALGPWAGVKLSSEIGLWAPFAVMAILTLALGAWSLWRRYVTSEKGQIRGHSNPLRFIPRFVKQPRLRLAYVLALVRSGWWSIFFIYAPIYCVNNGFSAEDAGLVVSLGSIFVVLAPLWGRLGAPVGMRGHLIAGYLATGMVAFTMAVLSGLPEVCVGLALLTCLCASWLDAIGNAPFVRAVHPHERAEMMSLYTTYREFGRILPQGVFAVVLLFLPLPAVFACAGLGMAIGAWYSRYIPSRY